MTRSQSRRIRQDKAATTFRKMRAAQSESSDSQISNPQAANPPVLTVLPDPAWIIGWRKSALRFLEDGRGYELVPPAEATRFPSEADAIDRLRTRAIRMSDIFISQINTATNTTHATP